MPKRRSETRGYAAFLQNAGFFSGRIPRVCTLGWYAMPRWGMGSKTWWRDWLQRSRADP